MKEEGGLTFAFTNVSHNTEAGRDGDKETLTLINGESSTGLCAWVSPFEGSEYPQGTTDGQRLGNALDRAFGQDGDPIEAVLEKANETGGTLTVSQNPVKGQTYWAWLWEITPSS